VGGTKAGGVASAMVVGTNNILSVMVSISIRMSLLSTTVFLDLGFTSKLVANRRASIKNTPSALELIQCHFGLNSGRMEGGFVLDTLVDRDRSVDYGGLDNLALDYGLNDLVNVVVDVFSGNGAAGNLLVGGWENSGGGFELLSLFLSISIQYSKKLQNFEVLSHCQRRRRLDNYLLLKLTTDLSILSMTLLTVLNGKNMVFMTLRFADMVLDGLNTSLVVVLVDLAVDCNGLLDLLNGDYGLLGDGGLELLADLCVVLTVAVAGGVSFDILV
jgi:hypothetical protein